MSMTTRIGIPKVTKKWTQRDGAKIRICDMGDTHLLRTIAMLKRTHSRDIADAVGFASMMHGEMASYFADQDVDRLMDVESDHPLFDDLNAEAVRRGLESR